MLSGNILSLAHLIIYASISISVEYRNDHLKISVQKLDFIW